MEHLEEQIAHLTRSVDELSTVIARQDRELDTLRRQVAALLDHARAQGDGGSATFGDAPPPHY
ncbi:MAG: SlyX family protein [Shimia sp.]